MTPNVKTCKLVLFSGTCIDIMSDTVAFADTIDATIRTIAIAYSRIPRWNGHLRLPLSLFKQHGGSNVLPANRVFTNELDLFVPGDGGEEFVTYTILHHSALVDRIIQKLHGHLPFQELRKLRLQALFHESGEVAISDIPGPMKKLAGVSIKGVETHIEARVTGQMKIPFPMDPAIKKADILAQDIEGYYGYKTHHEGVNVTEGFVPEDWMRDALIRSSLDNAASFYRTAKELFLI